MKCHYEIYVSFNANFFIFGFKKIANPSNIRVHLQKGVIFMKIGLGNSQPYMTYPPHQERIYEIDLEITNHYAPPGEEDPDEKPQSFFLCTIIEPPIDPTKTKK